MGGVQKGLWGFRPVWETEKMMWEASDCIAELVHPKPPLPWDCPMEGQSCHWCARPSARRGPGGCLLGCRGDSQRNAGVYTFAHKEGPVW